MVKNTKHIRGVALRVEIDLAESGHSRPLAATRGHLRPLARICLERPLAATCGHLGGAATCGHLRPLAATWEERPLAATCGHSSGCEWLRVAAGVDRNWLQEAVVGEAATCGHLRPLEWLRVAASGCVLVEIHGRVGILKKIGFAGNAFFFKFGG